MEKFDKGDFAYVERKTSPGCIVSWFYNFIWHSSYIYPVGIFKYRASLFDSWFGSGITVVTYYHPSRDFFYSVRVFLYSEI